VSAEQWAIGIQFHSDSTKPLEKTEWMQDVLPERSGKTVRMRHFYRSHSTPADVLVGRGSILQ